MINHESNQLFDRVRKDDMAAFELLFKRLYPRLKDFAGKVVKENDIAEDIVQEVFIKVWEKRKKIENTNIEAFFFRVLRNHCITHIKHLKVIENVKVKVNTLLEVEELYRIDFIRNEPYVLVEKELEEEINNTLHKLPEKCREVFLMSRMEGLKNREIAEKLGINIKNVERHITRALKTFRLQFGDKLPLTLIILIIKNMYS
jgi:RNA polymerase sigma-70 factor (ECF subfamily)